MDIHQTLTVPGFKTFTCVRSKSPRFDCELISTGLFKTYKTKIQSEQIQSAEVRVKNEQDWEGRNQTISQVFLKTDRGEIFLFNANEKEEIIIPILLVKINNRVDVEKINFFIDNSQEKLLIITKGTKLNLVFLIIVNSFVFVIILPMAVYFIFK